MNKKINWNSTQFICTLPDYERFIIRKRIISVLRSTYGTVDYNAVDEIMSGRVCDLNF